MWKGELLAITVAGASMVQLVLVCMAAAVAVNQEEEWEGWGRKEEGGRQLRR